MTRLPHWTSNPDGEDWKRDPAEPASKPAGGDVLDLYREAVRVDVKMEGPQFMGCNTSALKRAWEADRAALSSSAGPAVEAVAWRQKFKSDPWTYHHAEWPYADSERAAGAIVEPLFAHPAPATVEIVEAQAITLQGLAAFAEAMAELVPAGVPKDDLGDVHSYFAALAPATEGRKP